jgi:hypothetical protein
VVCPKKIGLWVDIPKTYMAVSKKKW